MKTFYVMYFLLLSVIINAQDPSDSERAKQVKVLTLEKVQQEAELNYPLTKKRDLISKTRDLKLSNISKGYLPQFSGANQFSWQSDVTTVPVSIPGVDIPQQDKAQYKAYTDINQLVYDGGVIRQKKKAENARANVEAQSLEVELYSLRERVNNLYFGILIIEQQQKTNELLKEDIRIGLKAIEAQIANGTSFRSNADILKAELLKADQQTVTLTNNRKAYLQMLGLFIDSELDDNTMLEKPETPAVANTINRPELKLFDFKNESLNVEKKMINTRDVPKLSLFAQSGMGNPGLNMFEEGMQNYFIGGVRMTWSLSHTKKKEKQIIELNKLQTEADRETFLFNTNQALKLQSAEISKLQENLAIDDDIVKLRNNVKKASLAQLQNGVINTSDYLHEVNEENLALQNKNTHETELLLAQYREKTTRGN